MPKLELFDETFDSSRVPTYEITIQVSLNGYSFAVMDQVKKCYVALVADSFATASVGENDWYPTIKQIEGGYSWIKGQFARTTLSFESPVYTFTPKNLFEPKRAKQLLGMVHPIDDLDEIRYSELPDGIICIYSIPSMLTSAWLQVIPSTKFLSYCQPILAYSRMHTDPKGARAVVATSNQLVTLAITQGQRLMHCGTIPVHTAEDATYHLMSICKSLGIKAGELELTLLSSGDKQDSFEPLLSRFFKTVNPYKPWHEVHYCYLLNRQKNRFANLFIQSLCE